MVQITASITSAWSYCFDLRDILQKRDNL